MTLRLTFISKIYPDLFGSLYAHTFSPTVLSKCLRIRALPKKIFYSHTE